VSRRDLEGGPEVPASVGFDREAYDTLREALAILSRAKEAALYLVLDAALAQRGEAYRAMETWRWVANAYDHVERAQREVLGIGRRGDPCLPDWSGRTNQGGVR
jgi:hypothetical protein